VRRAGRTVEVRGINIKSRNRARCAQLDDTPAKDALGAQYHPRCAISPVIRWIVPPALPSTVQRTFRAELTLEARCGLGSDLAVYQNSPKGVPQHGGGGTPLRRNHLRQKSHDHQEQRWKVLVLLSQTVRYGSVKRYQ
jgi:hypothetical protein